MKLVTDDKILNLSKQLLQNDKSIRDEILAKIETNHTEIQEQMNEVNVKFDDVDKKIEESTSEISVDDINKIFIKEE